MILPLLPLMRTLDPQARYEQQEYKYDPVVPMLNLSSKRALHPLLAWAVYESIEKFLPASHVLSDPNKYTAEALDFTIDLGFDKTPLGVSSLAAFVASVGLDRYPTLYFHPLCRQLIEANKIISSKTIEEFSNKERNKYSNYRIENHVAI